MCHVRPHRYIILEYFYSTYLISGCILKGGVTSKKRRWGNPFLWAWKIVSQRPHDHLTLTFTFFFYLALPPPPRRRYPLPPHALGWGE